MTFTLADISASHRVNLDALAPALECAQAALRSSGRCTSHVYRLVFVAQRNKGSVLVLEACQRGGPC